jgi:hypothetical protein
LWLPSLTAVGPSLLVILHIFKNRSITVFRKRYRFPLKECFVDQN